MEALRFSSPVGPEVLRLVSKGRLKPKVFRELPLQRGREAHEIIESRNVGGKMLLIP